MANMWPLVIKNDGVVAVEIEDMGITVDATSQIDLAAQYDYAEIANSDDLRTEVLAGNLIVNNGTTDLNATDGEEYLEIVNVWFLKDNHYTKTELNTDSAGGAVHWENVTNKPPFGFNWGEAILARILEFSATPPAGAVDEDMYIDTDDNHLYSYDGTTWTDVRTPIATERVISLDSTSENIFEFNGATWDDQGQASDNDAVIVNDDGDALPAIYIYDTASGVDGIWVKVADSDLILGGENTLDSSYDANGSGAGRSVTVDANPVKLDASSSTYAPLELTDLSSAPTTNLVEGQMAIINGLLYAYDATRAKWLSVQRQTFTFGRKGNSANQWLAFAGGSLASNNSGYRIMRNATIVGLSGQLDASGTCDMRVRRNDVATNIASLSLAAVTGLTDVTINVDLTATDFLQCYLEASSVVEDPMIVVEIAWRV